MTAQIVIAINGSRAIEHAVCHPLASDTKAARGMYSVLIRCYASCAVHPSSKSQSILGAILRVNSTRWQ